MQTVVEILNGSCAGHKNWVNHGQVLTVGRTDMSDLAVHSDNLMSSTHFAIRCDASSSYVLDMGSTNGTFLNGSRIKDGILADGDEVKAGETSFRVRVTGGYNQIGSPTSTDTTVNPLANELAPEDMSKIEYSNGRGPWNIPWQPCLTRNSSVKTYLVSCPEESSQPGCTDYLFPWLPDPIRARLSPIVLPIADHDLDEVLTQTWGQQDVLLIQSDRNTIEICEFLRHLASLEEAPSIQVRRDLLRGGWIDHLLKAFRNQNPITDPCLLCGETVLLAHGDDSCQWHMFRHVGE